MATTIVDYYDSAAGGGYVLNSADYLKVSQSFTANKGGVLNSCKFKLKKWGTPGLPTGNAIATVYGHSGTYGTSSVPTGTVLATSDNFDVSTLTTIDTWITFTFSGVNKITLISGQYYCIVLEYSGGDANNAILAKLKTWDYTHSGNSAHYISSWVVELYDIVFYVYRDSFIKDIISHGVIAFPR